MEISVEHSPASHLAQGPLRMHATREASNNLLCGPLPLDLLQPLDTHFLLTVTLPRLLSYLGSSINFPFTLIQDGLRIYNISPTALTSNLQYADSLRAPRRDRDDEITISRAGRTLLMTLQDEEHGAALLGLPDCSRTLYVCEVLGGNPNERPDAEWASFCSANAADSVVNFDAVDAESMFLPATSSVREPAHTAIISLLPPLKDLKDLFRRMDALLLPGGLLLLSGDGQIWGDRAEGSMCSQEELITQGRLHGFDLRGSVDEGGIDADMVDELEGVSAMPDGLRDKQLMEMARRCAATDGPFLPPTADAFAGSRRWFGLIMRKRKP